MNFLVGATVFATQPIWNRYGVRLDIGEAAKIFRRFPADPSVKATVVDVCLLEKDRYGQKQMLIDIALPERCLEEKTTMSRDEMKAALRQRGFTEDVLREASNARLAALLEARLDVLPIGGGSTGCETLTAHQVLVGGVLAPPNHSYVERVRHSSVGGAPIDGIAVSKITSGGSTANRFYGDASGQSKPPELRPLKAEDLPPAATVTHIFGKPVEDMPAAPPSTIGFYGGDINHIPRYVTIECPLCNGKEIVANPGPARPGNVCAACIAAAPQRISDLESRVSAPSLPL